MANVRLYLDTRKNTPIVKLSLSSLGKNTLITLGVRIDTPAQWSPMSTNGPIVNHPSSKSINALLRARLSAAQEVINAMMLANEDMSLERIKAKILERIEPGKAERLKPKDLLIEWLHIYQQQTSGRTRELYMITESRLFEWAVWHETGVDVRNPLEVHNNPKAMQKGENWLLDLQCADVTASLIISFETFLSRTMGTNSRAIHLRNLRAVLKFAIRNDVPIKDPFLKFKIKREETRHRALTPEQFRQLFTQPIPPKEKELHEYRDIALLIFMLIGINVADLYEAKSLVGGRLEYERRKTHRHYSIKVEPEALAILKKYKGKDYLLRYADTNKSHMSLTKKLDRTLKRIGPVTYDPSPTRNHQPFKQWHGLFPDISVYWLRHTWATFAAKIGIPRDTIAKCLGHGKKTVTDIYIDFDQDIIDLANRKVIDYALSLIK